MKFVDGFHRPLQVSAGPRSLRRFCASWATRPLMRSVFCMSLYSFGCEAVYVYIMQVGQQVWCLIWWRLMKFEIQPCRWCYFVPGTPAAIDWINVATKGCRPKLSTPRWIIQLVMGSKRCHGMKFWCCPGLEISWYDMIHDMIHDISTTFKDDLRRLGRH